MWSQLIDWFSYALGIFVALCFVGYCIRDGIVWLANPNKKPMTDAERADAWKWFALILLGSIIAFWVTAKLRDARGPLDPQYDEEERYL